MNVHVFVATTQGLVAIQRIYAQDPDIRSVVSINGTASVSPISAAYYHFVKKGVGIIENDFGGSAYRVNIDGNIDQGNSWQLGFYLAHAAHSQNRLGDGIPQPGEQIICATGQINTSERTVLGVAQIPLKIHSAHRQIQDWPKDISKYFLLPKANAADVLDESTAPATLHYLDSLAEGLKLLGFDDKSSLVSNEKVAKAIVSTNPLFLLKGFFTLKTSRWAGLALAFLLLGGLYYFSKSSPQIALEPGSHDTLISRANLANPDSMHVDEIPTKQQATLQLAYKDEDELNCQDAELDYENLDSVAAQFAPAPFKDLCEIYLRAEQDYKAVYAINRVSHRFVRASLNDKAFIIPLPSQSAKYLILALSSPIDKDHHRRLHSYLFNLDEETILSAETLRQLPALQDFDYVVLSHQLR
jgi:hypothetical protein